MAAYQVVADEPDEPAGQQVGERRQGDQAGRGVHRPVEVGRSPGERRRVDHVEQHERGADQQDRPPGHRDVGGGGAGSFVGEVREGAGRQRYDGQQRHPAQVEVGGGQCQGGGDQSADGPGAVERRQDRPRVAVLERDGLHVDDGVDDAEGHAVPAHGDREDRHLRGQCGGRDRDRDADQRRPQQHRGAESRGEPFGGQGADAREEHQAEEEQGQLELGQGPLVGELRQPGGQADEHEALGREGAGDGEPGPAEGRLGDDTRRHGPHRGRSAGRRAAKLVRGQR